MENIIKLANRCIICYPSNPPCPISIISCLVILSFARILGSRTSKTVFSEKTTPPGYPINTFSPLYASMNIAPGRTGVP